MSEREPTTMTPAAAAAWYVMLTERDAQPCSKQRMAAAILRRLLAEREALATDIDELRRALWFERAKGAPQSTGDVRP